MAEVQIKGLAKSFGASSILRDVELGALSGQFIAILGASGSGKTTLLRLICGFERADDGKIELGGELVCGPGVHVPPERRNIGYVAQEGALFPHLSVAANIVFGLPRSLRRTRWKAEEFLELVGLPTSYSLRFPQELSGGEQQRVALARALAPAPRLVLLDEPFSALDAALRVETRQAVMAALVEARATAILVTHDQSEALSMGEKVAVLRQGAVVQFATPETLYRSPIDAELAQFVGEAVLLSGVIGGSHVTCALGRLPLGAPMADGAADVMVRPEQIRLVSASEPSATRARVLAVTYYGHDAKVSLSLGEPAGSATARVAGHMAPRPGDEVGLNVEGVVMTYRLPNIG
jgi:iron(III) transport system ATP-binding protein